MTVKKAREFLFVVEARITMSVAISARTLEDAVEQATEAGVISLCHQCAVGEAGKWGTSGELDSDPSSSRLVEAWEGDEVLRPYDIGDLWPGGIAEDP